MVIFWHGFRQEIRKVKDEVLVVLRRMLNKVAAHRSGLVQTYLVQNLKRKPVTAVCSCTFSLKIMASPPPRPVVLGDLKYVQSGGKHSEKKLDLPTFSQVSVTNEKSKTWEEKKPFTVGAIWGAQLGGWKLLWLAVTDASQVSAGYSRKHSGDEPIHI